MITGGEQRRRVRITFYARLNRILDQHDFDGFVEGLCERFYADEGRPGKRKLVFTTGCWSPA
jgi:hypothetical protein